MLGTCAYVSISLGSVDPCFASVIEVHVSVVEACEESV